MYLLVFLASVYVVKTRLFYTLLLASGFVMIGFIGYVDILGD